MNPQKIGRAKHDHTGGGCLCREHRITMGTTPVCDLFSPPKESQWMEKAQHQRVAQSESHIIIR